MGVLTILALIAVTVYFVRRAKAGRQRELASRIAALPNFTPAVRYDRRDRPFTLLLDPVSEQFAMIERKQPVRLYGFQQLVAVEIERNGVSLEKANRGSQVVGAAIGGALLGPVGLLVGGVTGPKRREEKVKRLALRLYTNDLHTPFSEVVFFENKEGLKPNDKQVTKATLELEQWYGRFLTILRGQTQTALAAPEPVVAPASAGFGRRRSILQGA
jgi:hypothetical protein